jgi:hypothetical protein
VKAAIVDVRRHVADVPIADFDTRRGADGRKTRYGEDAGDLLNILPFVARNAPS